MSVQKPKFDAKVFLTKNSLDNDDVSAISDSLHKLRKCLINVDSISQFRQAGGIGNLIILYKKYSVILISLHSKNDEKIDSKLKKFKKTEKIDKSKFNKIIHEALGLLANCCHFDKNSKTAIIKNNQFLSNLVSLLQIEKLSLEIVASVMRLLGNLCDTKESAASVLQAKSLTTSIVHWMIRKFDDDNDLSTKIRDLSLRIFRSAANCSSNFARFLLQNDVAYHVAKFLSTEFCTKNLNSTTKSNVFRTLTELASSKDDNFAEQLIRADVIEEIIKIAKNSDEMSPEFVENSNEELCKLARKLLYDCIREYSDVRIEVSKYGAIELIHILARTDEKLILLLSKFCRDGFTRQKLRETDILNSILNAFGDENMNLEYKNELMNALVCFLYDDSGLVYILKRPTLMNTFVELLKDYTNRRNCTAPHSTLDKEMEPKPPAEDTYRPDSPSYVRLQRPLDEESMEIIPLCKAFAVPSSPMITSPSSSPGRSWSPSGSVPGSPECCRSPAWSLDSHETNGSSILTDDFDEQPIFSQSEEWFGDPKTSSNDQKNCFAKSLCKCGWTPTDKDEILLENLIKNIIFFLSWLSHTDNYAENFVSNEKILETLIKYVSTVCRPQPRVGRLLKRLARNRFLTEKLLKVQFHDIIRQFLCTMKCRSEPFCVHCRKLCRIGCDIILSFGAQVDSDFGFGVVAHEALTGNEEERLNSFLAVPYLIKTVGRRKRFLLDYGGLEQILNVFFVDSDNFLKRKSFEALRELISLRRLKDIWVNETCRINVIVGTPCELLTKISADQSTISFVSSDQQRKFHANKRILIENSSFYRAMFAGQFSESSKTVLETKFYSDTFVSFEIFIHFLHGCRQCPTCHSLDNWRQVAELLSLSDQHLRGDLYSYAVDNFVAKFLNKLSVETFLVASVLREDSKFFQMCLNFVFLFHYPSEFCDFLSNFVDNEQFLNIFKSMLTKFLISFV